MRALITPQDSGYGAGSELTDEDLARLYAAPADRWMRANMVSTLDGAAQGPDGVSGSVNSRADGVIFGLLRALADCVLVGSGTVAAEGYSPLRVDDRWSWVRERDGRSPGIPLVVISRSGRPLPSLDRAVPGSGPVELISGTPHQILDELARRGWTQVLGEGGPTILTSFLDAGAIDELCLSLTPYTVGGDGLRIAAGQALTGQWTPHAMVEQDGTVMTRWLRQPSTNP